MIQVENLTKYYGDRPAIQNVSFHVKKGEIVGFLGPNGAGKTTTMRILTGYLPATSGRVTVAGYDVFESPLEARQHIGYMPETVPLYPEMTVQEYLDFFGRVRQIPKRSERVATVMEMVNIGDRANQRIAKLSKGYRQRVGLAQALLHSPDILILDEPTIGLDPKQIIEVRQLIKNLAGEHTVILSTHILPEVSQTCQRVLIIHRGRIVAEDSLERLMAGMEGAHRVRLQVRRPGPELVARLKKVRGVEAVTPGEAGTYEIMTAPGSDQREELAAIAVQGGFGLLDLRTAAPTLEEIFLRYTTVEEAAIEPEEQETEDAEVEK